MNCEQVREALGDHSVGALEAPALAAFEGHLAGCADCERSLASFRRCLELLDHTPSPEPPAHLWLGVRARLELERSLASYAPLETAPPARGAWYSGAAAALSGFVAAMGFLFALSTSQGSSTASSASLPPAAVMSVRQNLMDGASPVADGASVVAAEAVSLRSAPVAPSGSRVILPGPELLGEPVAGFGDGRR